MKQHFHRLFKIGTPGHLPDDPGPVLRWGGALLFIFVGLGGLWMGLAPLDGAVISQGVVKVRSERILVQHARGGVVSGVKVQEGVTVKRGDPLIEISEPLRLAAYESSRNMYLSELARNARLRAEQAGNRDVDFPPAIRENEKDPAVAAIVLQERRVFANRRDSIRAAEQVLHRQRTLVQRERGQLEERAGLQGRSADIVNQQLNANQDLFNRGYVSRYRLLEVERAHTQEQTSRGELEADKLRAEQRIADIDLRLADLRNRFLESVADELKTSNERLYQLEQQWTAQQAELQRDVIKAPEDGAILNFKTIVVGSVISPGQQLMELVPTGEAHLLEAVVQPRDIRFLTLGGSVQIQVTSWNRRSTTMLSGTIEYVSADAAQLKENLAGYLVRVRIDPASIERNPGQVLKPGMEAVVYFKTTPRTILDYLFQPVIDSYRSAFREGG